MKTSVKWIVASILALVGAGGALLAIHPAFFFGDPGTCVTVPSGKIDDKAVIRARVQARWDALIKLDMEKVYRFATPAYRDTYDLVHLNNQYGAQIERTRIDILEINIPQDDPDTADVRLNLYFIAAGVSGGSVYRGESYEKETWVRRIGCWWYVEPR
ncbi:MAG: hypothetical protein ACRERU_09985 [Methylococcales bacterium]